MDESIFTLKDLAALFQGMVTKVLTYLPNLAVALAVLALGWLVARLVRHIVMRTINHVDQFWQRFISKRGLSHLQPRKPPARVVGELVFWLMMLVFITIAAEILGLDIVGVWLRQVVTYLPLMIVGLFFVLAGFVVSSLARDLVASTAFTAGLSNGDLLGRAVQIIILFAAIIIGVDQIGIDIAFLTIMAGIILGSMLGGVALAFGLGARNHVSNIIAATQLKQIYNVGDRVRIGDFEGRILDITVSRVIIETEAGTVDVPAKIFDEEVTIIIEKGA